jgi:hypothetical protein
MAPPVAPPAGSVRIAVTVAKATRRAAAMIKRSRLYLLSMGPSMAAAGRVMPTTQPVDFTGTKTP